MSSFRTFVRANWPQILGSAAVLGILFGNQGFRSLVSNWMELRRLNHEVADLQNQQAALSERLRLMRSGNSSLERMARLQLGYIKKGEIEYRFPPPSPQDQ